MTGIVSVPPTPDPSNTSPLSFSWDCTSKREMIAWLQRSSERLVQRAREHPDRRERDRLLKMAAAAIETAGWYEQNGGGR